MTRDEKIQHQLLSRKCRTCFWLSLGLVFSLSLIKMILSNRPATWGNNLEVLKQQVNQLKQENQYLTTQLALKQGGLIQLQQQAKNQGFTEKPQFKFLTPPAAVAQKLP